MLIGTTTIINETGLHARPASQFVGCAKQYKSKIHISHDGKDWINAKSIVMLLSGGFVQGDSVYISADGEDERQALDELISLASSDFGE